MQLFLVTFVLVVLGGVAAHLVQLVVVAPDLEVAGMMIKREHFEIHWTRECDQSLDAVLDDLVLVDAQASQVLNNLVLLEIHQILDFDEWFPNMVEAIQA